jgi:hypothetical protein
MNRESSYEERSQKNLHVNALNLDPEVVFHTNDVTFNSSYTLLHYVIAQANAYVNSLGHFSTGSPNYHCSHFQRLEKNVDASNSIVFPSGFTQAIFLYEITKKSDGHFKAFQP